MKKRVLPIARLEDINRHLSQQLVKLNKSLILRG